MPSVTYNAVEVRDSVQYSILTFHGPHTTMQLNLLSVVGRKVISDKVLYITQDLNFGRVHETEMYLI